MWGKLKNTYFSLPVSCTQDRPSQHSTARPNMTIIRSLGFHSSGQSSSVTVQRSTYCGENALAKSVLDYWQLLMLIIKQHTAAVS